MARRGRPEKFSNEVKEAIVEIIKQNGLTYGREIINRDGITVNGEKTEVSISLPTLGKIAKDYGLTLKRGRPANEETKVVKPVVKPKQDDYDSFFNLEEESSEKLPEESYEEFDYFSNLEEEAA